MTPTGGLAVGVGADGGRTRRRSLGFGASEWTWRCLTLAGLYVAIGYVVASVLGLRLHWPWAHLLYRAWLVLLVAYGSLLLAFVLHRAVGPTLRLGDLAGRLLSGRIFLEFVTAMLAVHVTLVVFFNLKQYVPALNPRLYDSPLWRLDARLHFGLEPASWLSAFAAEHGVLPLLDEAYLVFLPAQVLVPLLFLFSGRLRPMRGPFFFSYCLLWMLGSLVYVLWPALGPAYYWPTRFPWLELAPLTRELQWSLIQDYARFRATPEGYAVSLYTGVAALPSLHVAMFFLFAMATWRWRSVSVVLWVLTAITFAGSLALGWHYAVDGYAGALIAWGAWRAGRWLAPGTES